MSFGKQKKTDETRMTPVLKCEPVGLELKEEADVSLPCAFSAEGNQCITAEVSYSYV